MEHKSGVAAQVIQLLGGLIVVGLFSGTLALIAFLVSFLVLRCM